MADNIPLYPASGGPDLATNDIGGEHYQRVKLIHGAEGVNAGDVHLGNPFPVRIATDTVFGEVAVAEVTPIVQAEFIYGINTRVFSTAVTGSGTAVAANSLLTVSTTAAASSSATCSTRRMLKYRAGIGALTRFTAMFTSGAANSQQEVGPGTASEGFFIGFDGTAFGICRRKGGSDNWTPRASWNVDTMDGNGSSGMTLVPTNLNVYQIRFQYLGAGAIEFFVENPATGRMVLFHRVQWANQNTSTTVLNPSFPLRWRAVNTSNATNIAVSGASVMLALEGQREHVGPIWSATNSKTTITTETNILTLKMATTYNGSASQILADIMSISCAMSSNTNGIGTLRLILNATLGGSPAFSPLSGSTPDNGTTITSGQSSISVDTAGTTVTGGTLIFSAVLSNTANAEFNTDDIPLLLIPGDTLTLSISSTTSATVAVATSFVEDI